MKGVDALTRRRSLRFHFSLANLRRGDVRATGGTRTLKPRRAAGFEPALYANSSTVAEVRSPRYQLAGGPSSHLGLEDLSVPAGPVLHFAAMTRATLERRLTDIGAQLRDLRRDLAIADEQLAHFADEADDARLRSLVSETPLAEREHRTAARHAEAMERHRDEVVADIGRLEQQQDELLDRLNDAIG